VKDKTIAHAVTAAYAVATVKERSPEVHLFLELPADRVDVNVHPTKAEVRFLEQSLVHELIRRAIGDALGRSASPELQLQLSNPRAVPDGAIAPAIPGILAGAFATPRWAPDAGVFSRAAVTAAGPGARAVGGTTAVPPEATGLTGFLGENSRVPSHDPPGGIDAARPMPAVRPMTPLGQFRDTYIIAVDDEGIAIVDQHVAHERVLFERVMERLGQGRLPSQRLLAPVLVDLAASQREAVVAHHDDLDRLGYEIEEFGGKSVRITAVPALLGIGEAADAVRALAEDLEGLDRGARVDEALRRVAATTACHAAVKANDPLTFEKMAHILEELRRTAYSTVCPHGRPVVLRLTRREIEKNFQRI
jgi:DNA mismatch repair protein MutL